MSVVSICQECGEEITFDHDMIQPGHGFDAFHKDCWETKKKELRADHIEADYMLQRFDDNLIGT